ncbi:MAG TPA: C45 family peptidase [Dongiaceae bacterium]|jgi:isopenicillin-N N-acyltransferase-like protein|nr:C45 family peptidase [Dongiaceae bacterium]
MTYAAFPLIEISGPPFERGRAYGRAATERIKRSVRLYTDQMRGMDFSWHEVHDIVSQFVPVMRDYAPDLIEEMRGIAAGADCAFEEIALVNARTEVVQLGQRRVDARSKDGCTGVIVLPEASVDGALIHAQNWDWKPECVDSAIVLKVRRDDGPDLLTFTEAGGLARSGFNAAGLAITANYLESDRDYCQVGIPLPLIRRRVLESAAMAEGIRIVATTPKSASNNMMLSIAAGFGIDFECAPDEAFALYPDGGILVHANHWMSVPALSKLKETGIDSVPDSYYRDYRVRGYLAPKAGRITLDDVKAALFDDFGTPYAICRPPHSERANDISATVAMLVMQPGQGTMQVAPMPAFNRTFTTYTLDLENAARIGAPQTRR